MATTNPRPKPRLRGIPHVLGSLASIPAGILLARHATEGLAQTGAAVYALSAVVTGIAGLLSSFNAGFISPENLHWSVSAITLLMVVVGGFKKPIGPIVGWWFPAWGGTSFATV